MSQQLQSARYSCGLAWTVFADGLTVRTSATLHKRVESSSQAEYAGSIPVIGSIVRSTNDGLLPVMAAGKRSTLLSRVENPDYAVRSGIVTVTSEMFMNPNEVKFAYANAELVICTVSRPSPAGS